MSQGKVVLFATQKGGTGKTTTCISLAHAMSCHFGKKVAIVDSDEQATALSFYSQRKITANEPELQGVNLGFPEVAKITSGSPYRRQQQEPTEASPAFTPNRSRNPRRLRRGGCQQAREEKDAGRANR